MSWSSVVCSMTQKSRFWCEWQTTYIVFALVVFRWISFITSSHHVPLPTICPTYAITLFWNRVARGKYVSFTTEVIGKWYVPFSTKLMHSVKFNIICPYRKPHRTITYIVGMIYSLSMLHCMHWWYSSCSAFHGTDVGQACNLSRNAYLLVQWANSWIVEAL